MRVLFTLILTLTYLSALSQDQSTSQSQRKINESIDKILLLNQLDDISSGIYTNSLSWVYLVTDETSKRDLRNQILFEFPKIKDQIIGANLGIEYTNKLRALMTSVDSMLSVAEVNMKELTTFEDYFDSVGFTENYNRCKKRIDQEIIPGYQSIDLAIEKEITSEEKR